MKEPKVSVVICTYNSGEITRRAIESVLNNNYDNKSMVIKVTDEELLNKTGGIIQGMSGSPIIQNGKFVRSSY